MQNPSPASGLPANPPMSAPSMPAMPQMPPLQDMISKTAPKKKISALFWILILIVLGATGAAWWYINNQMPMGASAVVSQPKIDKEAREDTQINNDIGDTDLGNVDTEFQSVDQDLNSL